MICTPLESRSRSGSSRSIVIRPVAGPRGQCVTEKVADQVLALPLHGYMNDDQVAFIVQTVRDASINVGSGVAI